MLLKVLAARSFSVTLEIRARIEAEHELARIEAWHVNAVTAHTLADVFGDTR